ncbi:hypothetical protein BDW75DRAFT_135675 [Aspergillus navahoensis]
MSIYSDAVNQAALEIAKHLSENGSLHKLKRFGVQAILIQLANYIDPRLMKRTPHRDPAERRARELR